VTLLRTCGHDLDAHVAPVVLYADGSPQCLMLQAQHAAAAGQEVARVVKGVEACAGGGDRGAHRAGRQAGRQEVSRGMAAREEASGC
jgi:hypothetical protein